MTTGEHYKLCFFRRELDGRDASGALLRGRWDARQLEAGVDAPDIEDTGGAHRRNAFPGSIEDGTVHVFAVPPNDPNRLLSEGVSEDDGVVVGGGQKLAAVGRKRNAGGPVVVGWLVLILPEFLQRFCVEEQDPSVFVGTGQVLAVG